MNNMKTMNKGDEELLPPQYGYDKMNKLRRAFPSFPSIFKPFPKTRDWATNQNFSKMPLNMTLTQPNIR